MTRQARGSLGREVAAGKEHATILKFSSELILTRLVAHRTSLSGTRNLLILTRHAQAAYSRDTQNLLILTRLVAFIQNLLVWHTTSWSTLVAHRTSMSTPSRAFPASIDP